jgi:hypothetical protein
MQKKRDEQSGAQWDERSRKKAQKRVDDAVAEDKAIDAMVKRSIEFQGP